MFMKMRPLHDRVVVKRIEQSEQKVGSLFVPDSAKEKPQEGEVIAVGKGKYENGKLIEMDVKVGDRVLFGKYSGQEAPKSYGEDYLIMREDEILVVLE
jgi:chaperonin GroES